MPKSETMLSATMALKSSSYSAAGQEPRSVTTALAPKAAAVFSTARLKAARSSSASAFVPARQSNVRLACGGTVFVAPASAWNCVHFIDQTPAGLSQIA